jgi:hypothetical protein
MNLIEIRALASFRFEGNFCNLLIPFTPVNKLPKSFCAVRFRGMLWEIVVPLRRSV